MRKLAALLLALAWLGAQGQSLRVAEPSVGLAFSVVEVNRSAESSRARVLQDMERSGTHGCVAYCAVLAKVWGALLPVIQRQQPDIASPLRLVVTTADEVDAMSFPDGTIVISEPFIRRMGLGEEQMAFVLAHEAAHVLLQHERQTLTSMLALMPSALKRTPRDLYTELEFRYFALSDSLSVVYHQVELEADEVGLQLAALAGFAPDAQLRFMEQLSQRETRQTMLVMHPAAALRLQRLRDLLPLARRVFAAGAE